MGIEIKCILSNRSDSFETQIVNMSTIGLGVKTDSTLPFKIGDELTVRVRDLRNYSSKAKLIYTKKEFNNIPRLGLKFLAA